MLATAPPKAPLWISPEAAALEGCLIDLLALVPHLNAALPAPQIAHGSPWPSLDDPSSTLRPVVKGAVIAATMWMVTTHGYQFATNVVGKPERPSLATASVVSNLPSIRVSSRFHS